MDEYRLLKNMAWTSKKKGSMRLTKRDDLLDELLSLSNDEPIDMKIYSADKLDTNIFNADQWNSMMQYQELSQIAFA
ncbi:hypothetical protein LguiB_015734 [Lonicera macranthoides]